MSLSVCADQRDEHGEKDDEREHGRLGHALVELLTRPTMPVRCRARSPERATHSSAPIAGPSARAAASARSPHTFCGAGVPKIPDGRRSRNAMRITKTITS